MTEQIEIKRKIFDVVCLLGERSKKVIRKEKTYFLKDFGQDIKGFERYIDSAHKLSVSGIISPKIYIYDKNKHIVVSDFIEGPTVLEVLLKEDLPDDYFSLIFANNWYMKKARLLLDFDPQNFIFNNKKLFYLPQIYELFDDKKTFEKVGIWHWFYCREFVRYLEEHRLPVDQSRNPKDQCAINKKIALTVVKYYR